MQILQVLSFILNHKRTFLFLMTVTILIAAGMVFINRDNITGDYYTYLDYVKGIRHGRYTYWWFMKDYIPDTFRNPGYPLFLYFLSFISEAVLFIRVIQLLLLIATLLVMLKIIDFYDKSLVLKNGFLLLVLINFTVLTYPVYISPEILMMFLITLIIYVELTLKEGSWTKIISLALLYGFCFQVRPVILFLPAFRFVYFLYHYRKLAFSKNLVFISIFILTLLPYGCWNLEHHKMFKITPVEGGAGAMYLGYWSPKLIGHTEDKYWRNKMYEDRMINFVDKKEVPRNIDLFNREWDSLEGICSRYLTSRDSANIETMKQYPHFFITHNTQYTLEREKILTTLAIRHYLSDLPYTIRLKGFTFFRLWYTGWVQRDEIKNVNPLVSFSYFMAFIGTFFTLAVFFLYFVYCLFRRRDIIKELALPLLWCLYFDLIHLPFVIQARYTIPVRLLYLFSLAYMIYRIHFSDAARQAARSIQKEPA